MHSFSNQRRNFPANRLFTSFNAKTKDHVTVKKRSVRGGYLLNVKYEALVGELVPKLIRHVKHCTQTCNQKNLT